jgi:GxxExxY protein
METTEFTESTEGMYADLTRQVIGCAIEVHQTLGPGLLEATYEQCLAYEVNLNKIEFLVPVGGLP